MTVVVERGVEKLPVHKHNFEAVLILLLEYYMDQLFYWYLKLWAGYLGQATVFVLGKVHCGKRSVPIFQEFFASIG